MIFRLGSDNFAPPESDIPILDSQLVSQEREDRLINEPLSKLGDENQLK